MLGWELPPHNSGGLGVACYELAKSLSLEGVEIDFVLPYTAKHDIKEFTIHHATAITPGQIVEGGAGAYQSCIKGCESPLCEHGTSGTDIRSLQKHYTRYVESIAPALDPQVIHAHDWLTLEAGMQAKIMTGKPLIAHVHATEFDRAGGNNGNPLIHDIEYNGLMMADKVIAVSGITKNIIVKNYHIPADKIEVVHNGISNDMFENIDPTTQQTYIYLDAMKKQGYTVIVSLNRLALQKGQTFLLEAAAKALGINDKMLFLFAGSGEQREELIEKSAELGIADKVLFSGFVRGRQWRDAYRVSDIFVMSSVSEPFGLSALEAAGYGNAVVLTKQSGVGEVFNNVLRYDFWDVDKLANQLVALATHKSLQNELTTNARQEFGNFSWGDVSKKCLKVYRSHVQTTGGIL
jgi:glycosyltransferase involved in cell wall biosynthesis